MKTRFWKRGISSLLTATMLMGMLPFPVAAEKATCLCRRLKLDRIF